MACTCCDTSRIELKLWQTGNKYHGDEKQCWHQSWDSGQWADLHWLSNWFWVTSQVLHVARFHTQRCGLHLLWHIKAWIEVMTDWEQVSRWRKTVLAPELRFWSMSRFTLALQLILSDKLSTTCSQGSHAKVWLALVVTHQGLNRSYDRLWTSITMTKNSVGTRAEILVNEQIYTGSPIDSEWQVKYYM